MSKEDYSLASFEFITEAQRMVILSASILINMMILNLLGRIGSQSIRYCYRYDAIELIKTLAILVSLPHLVEMGTDRCKVLSFHVDKGS